MLIASNLKGAVMANAGMFIEDLKVGQTGEMTKTVTDRDIQLFAEVSGDNNPVHLDEAYAKTTMFKTRIAHGMLSAGFISAVFGTVMPGPGTIYMAQNLRFRPISFASPSFGGFAFIGGCKLVSCEEDTTLYTMGQ